MSDWWSELCSICDITDCDEHTGYKLNPEVDDTTIRMIPDDLVGHDFTTYVTADRTAIFQEDAKILEHILKKLDDIEKKMDDWKGVF